MDAKKQKHFKTFFMPNNKETQVFIPQSIEDLTEKFRGIIREELAAKSEKDLLEKYLSPEETCNLFQPAITKPTLESYSKKRLLKKYYLGGRTWFKYSEVIAAAKEIKKFSR